MSGSLTQFGIVQESTYGTAVAVTKFFEIMKESFAGDYPRVQAQALSSSYVDRADRYAVANKGAKGSVDLEVLTKGFGDWLLFMMGTVQTAGPTDVTAYTHTATMGNLYGSSFTAQVGRARTDGTVVPWTYEGGKVTGFEISNKVDETLQTSIECDFEKESSPASPTTPYTLQTLVPVTAAQVLVWQGGTITLGGTSIELEDISVKVDNSLNVDRYFINQTETKKEPVQDGKRGIQVSFTTPYNDNDLWDYISSATVAGSYATLHAEWEGTVLITGAATTYPSFAIDIPVLRLDEGGPQVEGPGMLSQGISGVGLYDGTNSALTLTYVTADATVYV